MAITNSEEEYFDLVTSGDGLGYTPKYKVLIEGDSWTSHPFLSHLAIQIDALGNDDFAILNLANIGDTARGMFSQGSRQLKTLRPLLYDEIFGYQFDMLFVSAGGNDLIGEVILNFVYKYNTDGRRGMELIKRDAFEEKLQEIVQNYKNLIHLRDTSIINRQMPIVCHCYSYLEPRRVGTTLPIFGLTFNDGWVKQYLDKNNIPFVDQQKIINEIIDRLYFALKDLENKHQNFFVVDTRKALLQDNKPNTAWFHDEIHPKGIGFKKIAALIRAEAKKKGVWPV